MSSTRVAEVKQARALVLADYVRSRAVRAAQIDQREKGRDDDTVKFLDASIITRARTKYRS